MARSKDKCPECGGSPEVWLAEYRKGGALKECCLSALRKRLRLRPKVASAVAHSKVIENQISRFLFGTTRDWKELRDLSGAGFAIEVKDYSNTLIAANGGAVGVLEAALEQCRGVCGELKPAACLHTKGARDLGASIVMLDDGTMMRLDRFKALIVGA